MSTVINTNIAALISQRSLYKTSSDMSTALQRLSTGLRINSAKDDAAGLAISERATSQLRGLNQAIRNAADGISVAQTAEGGLDGISSSLQRMRELTVQALNYSNTDDDRQAIQLEIVQLKEEIQRVAEQTKFNTNALLDGSFSGAVFQVGPNAGETITISSVGDMRTSSLGTATKKIEDVDVSTNGLAISTDALGAIDAALSTVTGARASLGAVVNRFEQTIANLRVTAENVEASRSRIRDADFAAETASLTRLQILQQSGTAVLVQANSLPQSVLQLLRN